MLASHLSFMSLIVDRPNAKNCLVESEFLDIFSCKFSIFLRTPYIAFFTYILRDATRVQVENNVTITLPFLYAMLGLE